MKIVSEIFFFHGKDGGADVGRPGGRRTSRSNNSKRTNLKTQSSGKIMLPSKPEREREGRPNESLAMQNEMQCYHSWNDVISQLKASGMKKRAKELYLTVNAPCIVVTTKLHSQLNEKLKFKCLTAA